MDGLIFLIDPICDETRSKAMETIMHPVTYLFEDIYRNYWGITPAAKGRKSLFRAMPLRLSESARRR